MSQCKWAQKVNISLSCRFGLLGISCIIMILDQVSKYIVRNNLTLYEIKPFMPFWNWTLAFNEGAAFSFLANQGGWQKIFFGAVSLIVSIALIYYILKKVYTGISGLALSFILGGAVGNMIDRIYAGKVTDFIDWYYGDYHWPAFNLADSFICIGVTLLIIEMIFFSKQINE